MSTNVKKGIVFLVFHLYLYLALDSLDEFIYSSGTAQDLGERVVMRIVIASQILLICTIGE